jgi:acyl-CoA synthetase (AMP-forming)/AMP-acid ligase II
VADVVLRGTGGDEDAVKGSIAAHCAENLPPHKVPALINIVPVIAMTPGGKVARANA